MVVAIASHDIEGHATKGLALRFIVKSESANGHEELLVCMCTALPEIKVIHGTKRLHVELVTLAADVLTVKSFRHEVSAAVFFQ